jgi:hypothetical protein
LKRAAGAKAGIYGNNAEEATYPGTRTDSDGQTLDGSRHNCTLTFPQGQQQPVNAFWSLTMYDGKTQLLIENPINRYLINSPMLPQLKKNADGSLTIYIQNTSPGAGKDANWPPAPKMRRTAWLLPALLLVASPSMAQDRLIRTRAAFHEKKRVEDRERRTSGCCAPSVRP